MERELQLKREKKRAIIVLSIILATIVAINLILWIFALTKYNGVKNIGNINIETHFFDNQKDSTTKFSQAEFVSEGSFDRLLILNNKSQDCYLRFWLISKMGDDQNSLIEVNNIITMSAENSFASSGYELTIVENERYLTSSEGKIYYTTDNNGKESVFQKNTTASIQLTFQVADLSGAEFANKIYSFEIIIEAVDVENPAISSWITPSNWPEAIV